MNIDIWETLKICKNESKCDDQHHYKAVLKAAMFSTPEMYNDNSPVKPNKSEPTKNPSTGKSLRLF